jgi:hypothetical protein
MDIIALMDAAACAGIRRVSPATAVGVSDRLWSMDDGEPKKRGPYKPRQPAQISK